MPLRYQIDDEHRVVLTTGFGVLTDQEIFEYKQSVWSREEVAGYDELVDVSGVDRVEFPTTERLRELARLSASMDVLPASRVAIVANDLVTFEIARMYRIFRKLDRRSIRDVSVFRKVEEAMAWLKAPAADPSSRRRGRRPSALGMLLIPVIGVSLASCSVSVNKRGSGAESATGAGVSTNPAANTSPAGPSGSSSNVPPEGPLRADESRVLGTLADPAEATPVLAPSSVRAGERFTVTITTTGSGCDRLGDSGVIVGERDATIMAYDFTSANKPGVACTMIFKTLKREIPLTFTQQGEGVIRVWGRRPKQDGAPGGEPFVVERRVEVRS